MKNPKLLKSISQANRQLKQSIMFLGGVLVAFVGYMAIVNPKAATPTAKFEAESALLTSGAVAGNDVAASNGQFTQFNNNPTPTPPPNPPPAGGCPAFPAFPDASCTGYVHTGVTLTNSGSITVTQDGTVIDSKNVTGCITVNANNVIIKRSKINNNCYRGIVNNGTNLLIEDVEVDGNHLDECVAFDNYTLRRGNLYDCGDGAKIGDNTTIEDSYIHDLYTAPDSHNDGLQSTGGSNTVVRHNNIEISTSQTSCVMLGNEFGGLSNILIEFNLFNGGGYEVYGGSNFANVTGIKYLNNKFGRKFFPNGGFWGPVSAFNSSGVGNQWSGNTWQDTGQTVNP